ncbi:MAG: AAA family ATPase [Candidatus Paceibacterota bacterium]
MYLSNLKLWNFRKFGSNNELFFDGKLREPDLEVNLNKGLNVLIGENDSGKSAIIDAIKIVLKTHGWEYIRLEHEDFYNITKNLRIECRFDDLSNKEAANFTEWIAIEGEEENAKAYLKLILEAQKNEERIFSFEVKAGADNEGYRLSAEAKDYLKTVYLRPLRDAESEFIPRKNSRLSQIFYGHDVFKGKDKEHKLVTEVFNEFSNKIKNYFKQGQEGEILKNDLDKFIEDFFGDKKNVEFGVAEKSLRNVLETLKVTIEEGRLGLGSHNILYIASELLNLNRKDWNGLRLGIIEELEAHLHPQAQLRIVKSLQENKGDSDVQFILTTHSPNLASKINLKNLIICTEDKDRSPNIFPMGANYTKLDKKDYKFLEKFLDVTKSNLFFTKGVVLVEGWSEEIILPILAEKLGIDIVKKGISIINVGGIAFLHYSKIFQRKETPEMNIPIAVITDLDIKPENEDNNLQKIINEKEEEYTDQQVKGFVSPHWTLEYCLSKSESIKENFKQAVIEVHPRIFSSKDDFDNKLEEQLKKGGLNKTEVAYRLAEIIKRDEEMVIDDSDEYIKYLIEAIKYVCK